MNVSLQCYQQSCFAAVIIGLHCQYILVLKFTQYAERTSKKLILFKCKDLISAFTGHPEVYLGTSRSEQ